MSDKAIGICLFIYTTVIATVMMCCGIYMRRWMTDAGNLLTYPTGFMNQVAVEWQT